ncbi:MAG: hypothetical protein P4L87_20445 [Formivibrio sp.]|nr:hypothetical protein [Formivibrio sp.]
MTEKRLETFPRLATIPKAAEIFANAGETPSAIRANIFKSADRYNSRGETIAGNGLAATGAIIRRGRKVLIDIDRYGAWLSGNENNIQDGKAALWRMRDDDALEQCIIEPALFEGFVK